VVYVHYFVVEISFVVVVYMIGWKQLDINNISELSEIGLDILFGNGIGKLVNVNLMLRETPSCWNLDPTQIDGFNLKKLSFYFWCCLDKSIISIFFFGKDNGLSFEVALRKCFVQGLCDGVPCFGFCCVLNIRK
jgi:hypothetical protein